MYCLWLYLLQEHVELFVGFRALILYVVQCKMMQRCHLLEHRCVACSHLRHSQVWSAGDGGGGRAAEEGVHAENKCLHRVPGHTILAWQCIMQHWSSACWAAPGDGLLVLLAQLADDAAAAAARSAAAANDADAAAGATGASADARRAVRPAVNNVALAQQHSAITSSGVFIRSCVHSHNKLAPLDHIICSRRRS